MPELPEVETVRTSLLPRLRGRRIVGLHVGEFEGVVGPLGVAATRARLLGRRIDDVRRRGKYLLLALDDDTSLLVHLRMTGRLQLTSRQEPPLRFEHLALELDGDEDLRFADQRKFGRVIHVSPDQVAALDVKLGPEPLDASFDPARLGSRLARRSGKLKAVLLDQRLVAGLGNIYVDEALFRARLHPERPAKSLSGPELGRLHRAIRDVLEDALGNRGTTVSSFQDGYGASGSNQLFLRVYGRGRRGEPCPRCGGPLAVTIVGGRSTHYCPRCQPLLDDSAPQSD
jgi:formamidopyrimidine-DNA glycosylase